MTVVQWASWALLGYSGVLFAILLLVDAPYGKRERDGWGPALPVRWSWLLLELPSFLAPLGVLWQRQQLPGIAGGLLLLFWLGHYGYRSFVYPWRLRPKPGAGFKLIMLFLGMPMNALIGYLMATMALDTSHLQDPAWLLSPRFLCGAVLALAGLWITRRADQALRNLRAPGESVYRIPRGGLYNRVSCPNYLGEILQWSGFALAAWALPALAFAVYTLANLLPRALASHHWYREQFSDYPLERRALIPFIV